MKMLNMPEVVKECSFYPQSKQTFHPLFVRTNFRDKLHVDPLLNWFAFHSVYVPGVFFATHAAEIRSGHGNDDKRNSYRHIPMT